MMNDAANKKVLARLRKIAGQVGGIARMVEEAFAQAALGEAGKVVLCSHVETRGMAVRGDSPHRVMLDRIEYRFWFDARPDDDGLRGWPCAPPAANGAQRLRG